MTTKTLTIKGDLINMQLNIGQEIQLKEVIKILLDEDMKNGGTLKRQIKEINKIKTADIPNDDSRKEKVKKKDKKLKVKKKNEETSKSKTLDTSVLLKKKNDRNGI